MKKNLDKDYKIGLFVTVGLALIMIAITLLGGADSIFTRSTSYVAHLKSSEGLITGAKVVLAGVPIGTVKDLEFEPKTRTVRAEIVVQKKYAEAIKTDSMIELMTQGVLGDKYISIASNDSSEPPLSEGGELGVKPSQDLGQFVSKGDDLLTSLNSIAKSMNRLLGSLEAGNRSEMLFQGMATTAKNLSSASQKLNSQLDGMDLKKSANQLSQILEKINNGTGTLGALVNDPSLYDDARSLVGGANRNRIIRNLVRKTIKDSEEQSGRVEDGKKK